MPMIRKFIAHDSPTGRMCRACTNNGCTCRAADRKAAPFATEDEPDGVPPPPPVVLAKGGRP